MTRPRIHPRQRRLTRSGDFRRVYRSGRRLKSSSVTIFLLDNTLDYFRVGLTVTRKFGKAVGRNRVRRRLREIFRRNASTISSNWDIVVNVNPEAGAMSYSDLEKEILGQLGKAARGRR